VNNIEEQLGGLQYAHAHHGSQSGHTSFARTIDRFEGISEKVHEDDTKFGKQK
jgi:hypothetical protein